MMTMNEFKEVFLEKFADSFGTFVMFDNETEYHNTDYLPFFAPITTFVLLLNRTV